MIKSCVDKLKQSINSTSAGITTLHCNVLDNADLEKLGDTIQESFGGADIVIDNGISNILNTTNQDCGTFVDLTSERLRATINVSIYIDE